MTDAMLGMLTTTPHAMGHAACSQARPASLLMRVCPAVPRGRRAAGGGGDVQRDKPPRPGPSLSQLPGSEIKWLQPQRISRFHLCVVLCCVFVFVFIFVLPVPRDMQAYDVPVDPMFLAEPRPSTVSTAAAEELLDHAVQEDRELLPFEVEEKQLRELRVVQDVVDLVYSHLEAA